MKKKCTMKEMPASERPYEKCERLGAKALTDAELLAVILRSGTKGTTSLELSRELLRIHPDGHPLADLASDSLEELSRVPGIGRVKAIQLHCIGELACRISAEQALCRISMTSAESIAQYFMEDMRHLDHEEIRAAFFDTKNKLLRWETLSKGTVNAAVITPREVFLSALRHHAVFVVLLHNHPSGDPSPSDEDLMLTLRMKEAGRLLEVPLLDHIIIGDLTYFSLKEHCML